jgi:hypothetical protein
MDEESVTMRAQDAYISQFQTLVEELNRVIGEVPEGDFYRRPGPSQNPVGWNWWHLLRIWDMELNKILQGRDISEDTWHRGGFSERSGYNPDGEGGRGEGTGMGYTDAQVDEVRVAMSVIQAYQQQLLSETEAYLREAGDAELTRTVTSWLGETPASKIVEQAIRNGWMHYGEMRYAKGILGHPDPTYPGSSG